MKKFCLLFGIIFLLCSFVCAETLPKLEGNGRKVHVVAVSSHGRADYAEYEQYLAREIFSKWKSNINDDGLYTGILFKLNKDGTFLGEPEFWYFSNNLEFDKIALDAIKSINNFKPLPEKTSLPYVKFRADFYNPGTTRSNNISEVDFKPYMINLQKKIKANWYPKNFNSSNSTTVIFKISKDGTISELRVYRSSGDPEIDEAGIQAVRKTKIDPLPREFNGKDIDIMFTFDINFYGDFYNRYKNLSSSQKIGSVNTIHYEILDNNFVILKKNLIRSSNGYKYINALKTNPFTQNAYLYRCKVDCKNKQIGISKVYAGSSNQSYAVLGFSRYVNIFTDEVKMQSPDKNKDYKKIYNYVCQP